MMYTLMEHKKIKKKNDKKILASKKFLFFLITLLCICIYIVCQRYGISLSPDIRSYQYHSVVNTLIADKLYNEVKILCWVMTYPDNHHKKAIHVKRTWGKRCNKILFMSTKIDKELETIALPVLEGYQHLWDKTREAFKYIYNNHLNEYDWFLKVDDDTYVIVENLRYLLYTYDPQSPLYFGCRFKIQNKSHIQGYMSGGAGYVLSKKSVKMFVEDGLQNLKCNQSNDGPEDVEMGRCLENIGVIIDGDSRDSNKLNRFFPFYPFNYAFWYWNYLYYKPKDFIDCCSNYAISFHYLEGRHMYIFDYLIYHVRPVGTNINKVFFENLGTTKNSNNTTNIVNNTKN